MIDLLLEGRQAELDELRASLAAQGRRDTSVVNRMEAAIQAAPSKAFSFDVTGAATVEAAGHRFGGGRFALKSLGELRAAVRALRTTQPPNQHRVRLSVLCGRDPATDIGLLQAAASPGSLFQVASQFNCLEAPGESVVPVSRYFRDPTQGPRASVSAFPGTLLRHYAAPADDGARFVQTDARQVNLLVRALPDELARVESGYLLSQNIPDLGAAVRALEERFDELRVGVHDELEVVLGANWDGAVTEGQRIAQVFTSTYAGGGYSTAPVEGEVVSLCRLLLRAAYLGTLLAGAALGKRTVVLTMIGGGVFGNPHALIWESLLWAAEQTDPLLSAPLHVVLNGREVDETLGEQVLAAATRARGGALVRVAAGRVVQLS